MEVLLLLFVLFGLGVWTKRQNAKHMRQMHLKEVAQLTEADYKKLQEANQIIKALGLNFKAGEFEKWVKK